jgi:hypothetical protein
MPDKFRKVFGHSLAIMRDKHSPLLCHQRQHFLILYASQVRGVGRLDVYAWLAPQRGFYDNVVEVGIRYALSYFGYLQLPPCLDKFGMELGISGACRVPQGVKFGAPLRKGHSRF